MAVTETPHVPITKALIDWGEELAKKLAPVEQAKLRRLLELAKREVGNLEQRLRALEKALEVVRGEIPSFAWNANVLVTGTKDGSNTIFSISVTPDPPESLHLFINQAALEYGVDYVLHGRIIEIRNTTFIPRSTDRLWAWCLV